MSQFCLSWHSQRPQVVKAHFLLRAKAVVELIAEPLPVVLHGVHHVFHPPVTLAQWPDAGRGSKLVFIFRDAPLDAIRESFERFVVAPPAVSDDVAAG